jgi:hypothetical protein
LGEAEHPAFGTTEHMQKISDSITTDLAFVRKGCKVAMRSFYGWHGQMLNVCLPSWHTLLLVLVHLGLKLGLFTPDNMPLWGSASQDPAWKPQKPKGASSSSAAATHEDAKLEAKRLQCSNTLHFVCMVLASARKHRRCLIIAKVSKECFRWHASEQENLTTPANVARWYANLALGKYLHKMKGIFACLSDINMFKALGLTSCIDVDATHGPHGQQGSHQEDWDTNPCLKAHCDDEHDVMGDLWGFSLALFRRRIMSFSHHDASFPGLFALLVSTVPAEVQLGLDASKQAWAAISVAEKVALGNVGVKKLLDAIPFSDWVLVREVLICLAQWDFTWVPPPIEASIKCIFCGWGHSCIDEEAFNKIKDHQRDSKNLRMSRVKRWVWPKTNAVIPGRYKRPEVDQSAAHVPATAPRRLNVEMFESQADKEPSVDDETLKAVTGRATWKTFTPLGMHAVPAAYQLLLHCSQSDDWDAATTSWRAIFVMVGVALVKKGTSSFVIVLASNQFGVLGWPCQFYTEKGVDFVRLALHNRAKPTWFPVLAWDAHDVHPLTPIGPATYKYKHKLRGGCDMMHLLAGPATPILVHAARLAFHGVAGTWLDKLMVARGLLADPSKSVFSKVEGLVRSILPDLSDPEVASIMQQRAPSRKKDDGTSLLTGANAELLTECMESSDKKGALKIMEEFRAGDSLSKQVTEYLRTRGLVSSASGSGSKSLDKGSSSSRKPTQGPKLAQRGAANPGKAPPSLKHETAKGYLPQGVKGVILQAYAERRLYQMYYPNENPPRSCSFTYAADGVSGFTETQVLIACLRWAWKCHAAKEGQPCPYPWIMDADLPDKLATR